MHIKVHSDRLPLAECADITGGVTLGRTVPDGGSLEFPYLRVANVQDGYIDVSDVKTVRILPSEIDRFKLHRGDVLLTEGGDFDKLGRGAVWDGRIDPCLHQNHVFRVRCNRSVMLPDFLALYLSSHEGRKYFLKIGKQTTNLATINSSQLKAMPIPRLPLNEQLRIVDALNAVNQMERSVEESIRKLRATREATISAMLDDLEWNDHLHTILSEPIRNGFSPDESRTWTGIQMLGLGCITSEGFEPRQLKYAPTTVTSSHPAILRDGDLLMTRANTRHLIGLAGIYREIGVPCIYPDLMMRLRVVDTCRPTFLEAVLRAPRTRHYIMAQAQGTSESMVKISSISASSIPIPFPDLETQSRLLAVNSEFGQKIDVGLTELGKLQALKLGLTDDLLAGKVR